MFANAEFVKPSVVSDAFVKVINDLKAFGDNAVKKITPEKLAAGIKNNIGGLVGKIVKETDTHVIVVTISNRDGSEIKNLVKAGGQADVEKFIAGVKSDGFVDEITPEDQVKK